MLKNNDASLSSGANISLKWQKWLFFFLSNKKKKISFPLWQDRIQKKFFKPRNPRSTRSRYWRHQPLWTCFPLFLPRDPSTSPTYLIPPRFCPFSPLAMEKGEEKKLAGTASMALAWRRQSVFCLWVHRECPQDRTCPTDDTRLTFKAPHSMEL